MSSVSGVGSHSRDIPQSIRQQIQEDTVQLLIDGNYISGSGNASGLEDSVALLQTQVQALQIHDSLIDEQDSIQNQQIYDLQVQRDQDLSAQGTLNQTLQSQITAILADTTLLHANLATEQTNRVHDDNVLNQLIQDVSTTSQQAAAGLQTEIQSLQFTDFNHATDITNLRNEVETAGTGLLSRMTAVEAQATVIAGTVTAETLNRQSADGTLQLEITQLQSQVQTPSTGLIDRVTALEGSTGGAQHQITNTGCSVACSSAGGINVSGIDITATCSGAASLNATQNVIINSNNSAVTIQSSTSNVQVLGGAIGGSLGLFQGHNVVARGFTNLGIPLSHTDDLISWAFLQSMFTGIFPIGSCWFCMGTATPPTFGGLLTWQLRQGGLYLKTTDVPAQAGTTQNGVVMAHTHSVGTYASQSVLTTASTTGNNSPITITETTAASGAGANSNAVGNTTGTQVPGTPSIILSSHTHPIPALTVPGAAIVGESGINIFNAAKNEVDNIWICMYVRVL